MSGYLKKQLEDNFMINILIIDDDGEDSEFLCDAICQVNPETRCMAMANAADAIEGLKTKKVTRPDLIFLDLNMPSTNGVQCLKELKDEADLSDIPVVIYTTSKSYEDRAEALRLGAVDFITKPSSFRRLCQFVEDVFNKDLIR